MNDFEMSLIASVFEEPGLPVIINGIWFKIQVIMTKMFSFKGVFFPIPYFKSI